MSKANDIADVLAARLNADPDLGAVEVIVDRQKDITAVIAGKLKRSIGCTLVLLYTGFKNPDKSRSGRPTVTRTYTLSAYGLPVLQSADSVPADEAIELAARCLHNWDPDPATDGFDEIDITGGFLQPDAKYLVYPADIAVTSAL
jgi:hypothetical protein